MRFEHPIRVKCSDPHRHRPDGFTTEKAGILALVRRFAHVVAVSRNGIAITAVKETFLDINSWHHFTIQFSILCTQTYIFLNCVNKLINLCIYVRLYVRALNHF